MYPREVAATKHQLGLERLSMDKVVGNCYGKPMENRSEEEAPVIVQDGVLTLTPLISEVRVRIKKRKLEEEEVVVDDDHVEEDQGKKKRVLTGVRWTGESVRT